MKRVISGTLKLSSFPRFTEKRRHAAAAATLPLHGVHGPYAKQKQPTAQNEKGPQTTQKNLECPHFGFAIYSFKGVLFSLCKCATIIPAVGSDSQWPIEKNNPILILPKTADFQKLHQSTKCITDPPLTGVLSLDTGGDQKLVLSGF